MQVDGVGVGGFTSWIGGYGGCCPNREHRIEEYNDDEYGFFFIQYDRTRDTLLEGLGRGWRAMRERAEFFLLPFRSDGEEDSLSLPTRGLESTTGLDMEPIEEGIRGQDLIRGWEMVRQQVNEFSRHLSAWDQLWGVSRGASRILNGVPLNETLQWLMDKMRGNGVSQGEKLEGKSEEELQLIHWRELNEEKNNLLSQWRDAKGELRSCKKEVKRLEGKVADLGLQLVKVKTEDQPDLPKHVYGDNEEVDRLNFEIQRQKGIILEMDKELKLVWKKNEQLEEELNMLGNNTSNGLPWVCQENKNGTGTIWMEYKCAMEVWIGRKFLQFWYYCPRGI